MLAVSIFFFAIRYVKARDWKRYFFCCLIATLIHTSAITFLPLYFLYGVRATPRRCIAIMLLAVVGLPLFQVMLRFLLRFTRFSRYIGGFYDTSNFSVTAFAFTLFYACMHIFYLARFPEQDKDFEWMTYVMVLCAVTELFSAAVPQIDRIVTGLGTVQILSFPAMLKKENNQRMRVLVAVIIVVIQAVYLFLFEMLRNGMYIDTPYKWIFFR